MLTCLVAGVFVLQLGLHKTNCPFIRLLSPTAGQYSPNYLGLRATTTFRGPSTANSIIVSLNKVSGPQNWQRLHGSVTRSQNSTKMHQILLKFYSFY